MPEVIELYRNNIESINNAITALTVILGLGTAREVLKLPSSRPDNFVTVAATYGFSGVAGWAIGELITGAISRLG